MLDAKPRGRAASVLLHSISDAKRELSLGHTKISAEIRAGNLEARKIGRRTMITDEALRRYIKSLPIAGAAR